MEKKIHPGTGPIQYRMYKYSTQGLFVVRLTIALQEMLVFENQKAQKEKDVGTLKGVDHWRYLKKCVTGCLAGGFKFFYMFAMFHP